MNRWTPDCSHSSNNDSSGGVDVKEFFVAGARPGINPAQMNDGACSCRSAGCHLLKNDAQGHQAKAPRLELSRYRVPRKPVEPVSRIFTIGSERQSCVSAVKR